MQGANEAEFSDPKRSLAKSSTAKKRGTTVFPWFDSTGAAHIINVMEKMEINSEGWFALLAEIANNYSDGALIPHQWLKDKLGLKRLDLNDFESPEELIKGHEVQQFAYMSFIDNIRWQLLEKENIYLRNIRGDGYVILNPKDQTKFGYDRFINEMKKLTKECDMIMNRVKNVPEEQRSKDNDMRAKFNIMRTMLSTIK